MTSFLPIAAIGDVYCPTDVVAYKLTITSIKHRNIKLLFFNKIIVCFEVLLYYYSVSY